MRTPKTPRDLVVSIVMCFLLLSALAGGCRMGAPAIVSTQPSNGAAAVPTTPATIQVNFDQPMATSSVERAFTIRPEVGTDKPKFAWSGDGKTLVVTFAQPLQANTVYTVTIGTDAHAANAVTLGQPVAFSFTTASTAVAGEAAGPVPTPASPAEEPGEETPPTISFAKDIQPIARVSCDGCHQSQATGRMSDYDNIIGKRYVVPNDADNSPYYKKGSGLVSHGGGDVWKGNKQLVREWIAQGAPV
ncbi:MAG: Ig-like domain-containing protein [Armatimonadota bacterium]|nr:Ig-like domain-containing protein [Armatimonadota bacterium]